MCKDNCSIGGLFVMIHPQDNSLLKFNINQRSKKYFGSSYTNKLLSVRNALYVENCVMLERFIDDEEELRKCAWEITMASMSNIGELETRPDLALGEDMSKIKQNKLKSKFLRILSRFVDKDWIPMRDSMMAESHLGLSYMAFFDEIIQKNNIIHKIKTNRFNLDMWVEVNKTSWLEYYLEKYNFSNEVTDI